MVSSCSSLKGVSSLGESPIRKQATQKTKKRPISQTRKRRLPGTPRVGVRVVALTPEELITENRFPCEYCNRAFAREQNLSLHLRGHNLEGKLMKRDPNTGPPRSEVYVCPDLECIHHDPARALGDITGIKKHYSRKHLKVHRFRCKKCDKGYAVEADVKAHFKTCGAHSKNGKEKTDAFKEKTTHTSPSNIHNELNKDKKPTFSFHNLAPLNTNSETFLDSTKNKSSLKYNIEGNLIQQPTNEFFTGSKNHPLMSLSTFSMSHPPPELSMANGALTTMNSSIHGIGESSHGFEIGGNNDNILSESNFGTSNTFYQRMVAGLVDDKIFGEDEMMGGVLNSLTINEHNEGPNPYKYNGWNNNLCSTPLTTTLSDVCFEIYENLTVPANIKLSAPVLVEPNGGAASSPGIILFGSNVCNGRAHDEVNKNYWKKK